MKIKQTIFLVSKVDGHFNVYDYFIPTRAFRFKKDAINYIKSQHDPSLWQLDTIVLE